MTWLSMRETELRIEACGTPDALCRLYGISLFADRALYAKGFRPDNEWVDAIVLSPAGAEIAEKLCKDNNIPLHAAVVFSLLRVFYHEDILIDWERSNYPLALALLGKIHSSGKARWPYVFGNLLYHKFNREYKGNRVESLDPGATHDLLQGTPQGVFQIGNLLSGPLGFVVSDEHRVSPPTRRLALWHCSDPGCMAKHEVQLEPPEAACEDVRHLLSAYLESLGRPSEWHRAVVWRYERAVWPSGRPFCDLPGLLGDCIVGNERRCLLNHLIHSRHNRKLTSVLSETRGLQGKPDKLIDALSPEEQHQLALVLSDEDLIEAIDDLVLRKIIHIPPSEIRKPEADAYRRGGSQTSVLSSLGVQSTKHSPPIELAAHIWNTYESLNLADDLAWRVRRHEGPTLRHSVFGFMKAHGPEATVKELVLSSRRITEALSKDLHFHIYADEQEATTCARLL